LLCEECKITFHGIHLLYRSEICSNAGRNLSYYTLFLLIRQCVERDAVATCAGFMVMIRDSTIVLDESLNAALEQTSTISLSYSDMVLVTDISFNPPVRPLVLQSAHIDV